MADFANGSTSRGMNSRTNDFRKIRVPARNQVHKSPFWKLALEIADEYKGKINPATKRKYTRDERLRIGVGVAGRIAGQQRRGRKHR